MLLLNLLRRDFRYTWCVLLGKLVKMTLVAQRVTRLAHPIRAALVISAILIITLILLFLDHEHFKISSRRRAVLSRHGPR